MLLWLTKILWSRAVKGLNHLRKISSSKQGLNIRMYQRLHMYIYAMYMTVYTVKQLSSGKGACVNSERCIIHRHKLGRIQKEYNIQTYKLKSWVEFRRRYNTQTHKLKSWVEFRKMHNTYGT